MKILRVVGSFHPACGCFVGVYETYSGAIVYFIDKKGRFCPDPGHRDGGILLATDGHDGVGPSPPADLPGPVSHRL